MLLNRGLTVIHSVPFYKKRSYKKRLVDLIWYKKRRLVDFSVVRNAFLRQLSKLILLRNDGIKYAGPSQGISIDGWQQLALSKIDTRQFLITIGIA